MKPKIKVTKNGPYIVSGSLPISKQIVVKDSDSCPEKWKEGSKIPVKDSCALCRCGGSRQKPFCDGTHLKINFDGTETADRKPFTWGAEVFEGPNLNLMDNRKFCAHARFCTRLSGVWDFTDRSDDPECRQLAIEQSCNCPSGRLVACEKSGKEIEPKLEPSIGLVEEPDIKLSGPIWLRGKVPVESADGKEYEIRNRITLCRCGKSGNKPFCDGAHISASFNSEE